MSVPLTTLLILAISASTTDLRNADFVTLFPLLMIVPVSAVLVIFGARAREKKEKPAWDSYQLTMSPNLLRRVIVDLPPIEIFRQEVTKIVDAPDGLSVATADRHRFIFVPKELVDFEPLRARLAAWHPIEPLLRARAWTAQAVNLAWLVLIAGCCAGLALIRDIRLVLLVSGVFLAALAYLLRETLQSRIVTAEQRGNGIRSLAFVALFPIGRLVAHFVFHADPSWGK